MLGGDGEASSGVIVPDPVYDASCEGEGCDTVGDSEYVTSDNVTSAVLVDEIVLTDSVCDADVDWYNVQD